MDEYEELTTKLREFLDSEEGQAAMKEWSDKIDREEKVTNKFDEWLNSMPIEKQDRFIKKVIDKYASDEYRDRYWKHGMFPTETLFYYINDFICKYGVEVGQTDDGEPIWEYNHWRVDSIYGQGETHYNFVYIGE